MEGVDFRCFYNSGLQTDSRLFRKRLYQLYRVDYARSVRLFAQRTAADDCIFAWICIFMYPIYRFKANTRNVLLLLGISIPVLLNIDRLMRLYLSLTGTADIYEDYLKQDGGLSAMGLVIWGSIWLFCTVFLYRRKSNALDPRLCNLLLVSFVLRIVSVTAYANFFRIAMYFSVFNCLVVADACACKEESTFMVRLKTLGVSVALLLYYFVAPNANILTYTV